MVLACSSIIWRLEDVDIFAANFVLYERNVIAVLLNVLKLNLTKVLVQKSRTGLILATMTNSFHFKLHHVELNKNTRSSVLPCFVVYKLTAPMSAVPGRLTFYCKHECATILRGLPETQDAATTVLIGECY